MTSPRRIMGLLLATGLAGAAWAAAAPAALANPSPPYTDTNAVGYIGLCNQAGQQVTSGSVSATPFAWRAVSSQAAPAPYNNAGRTAILLAYLPQQGLPPGDWSSEELTASSHYTDPSNPMAAATYGDDSLATVISDYPPNWDGFYQLRMYLGTVDAETYEAHYPVLNIQVRGNKWYAVGGGPVNCGSGSAESLESVLLPKSATSPSTTAPVARSRTTGSGAGSAHDPSGATGQSNSESASSVAGPGGVESRPTGTTPSRQGAPLAGSSSKSSTGLVVLVVALAVAGLAALGGGGYLRIRRRHAISTASGSDATSSFPTKGKPL